MNKPLLAIAAVASLLSVGPVAAQTKMQCTQAEMDKVQSKMSGMSDKKKQDTAMKEMKMAGDMMKKNDMKGCMMHLDKADKAAGKPS